METFKRVVLIFLGATLFLALVYAAFVHFPAWLQITLCVVFGALMPFWFSGLWNFLQGSLEASLFGAMGLQKLAGVANPQIEVDTFIYDRDSPVWELEPFQ